MNEARCKFNHYFIRKIAAISAVCFRQRRSSSARGPTDLCPPPPPPWMITSNWPLNQIGIFFVQKIETIGLKLDNMEHALQSLSDDHTPVSLPQLSKFNLQSEEEVRKLISSSAKKKLHFGPHAEIPGLLT